MLQFLNLNLNQICFQLTIFLPHFLEISFELGNLPLPLCFLSLMLKESLHESLRFIFLERPIAAKFLITVFVRLIFFMKIDESKFTIFIQEVMTHYFIVYTVEIFQIVQPIHMV